MKELRFEDLDRLLEYGEALEGVVQQVVAYHDAFTSGRFDDLPNLYTRVLNATTNLQHVWPDEYKKLLGEEQSPSE